MLVNRPPALFHSNKYSSTSACEHCGGVIRHETWCITGNSRVFHAYDVLLHADHLTLGDRLILHALGAAWSRTACDGNCQAAL